MSLFFQASKNILLFTALIMPYIAFCVGPSSIVICCDTTGSMSGQISMVKDGLSALTDNLPNSKIALMEYKDYGDNPVTRSIEPTKNPNELREFIHSCQASGGNDPPEAVEKALDEISEMDVSDAVLIHDAPPHALDNDPKKNKGDNYPTIQRIPDNKHHSISIEKLKNKRISLHTITCNHTDYNTKLWASMSSSVTGGISVNLKHNNGEKFSTFIVSMINFLSKEKKVFEQIHELHPELYQQYGMVQMN